MSIRLFTKAKRGVGVFLLFLLVFGMLPVNVLAAPELEDGETGKAIEALSSIGSAGLSTLSPPAKDAGSGSTRLSRVLAYALPESPAVTQTVYLDAPTLDALPAFANKDQFAVSGSSKPGATVSLQMSKDGGSPAAQGSVAADTQGRFSLSIQVPGEGTYSFTAKAELNGTPSLESSPVTTTVDMTPPGPVTQLTASNPAYNSIELQWTPPADPDVDHYFIDHEGHVDKVQAPSFTDSDLKEESSYCYGVTAVDRAGNQSAAEQLCTGTLPSDKLTNLNQWYHNYSNLHHDFGLSRDGATVVYRDVGDSGDAAWISYVHYLDVKTGENKILNPDNNEDSYGFSVSADGQVIAFDSYVEEQNGYDIYVYDRSNQSLTSIKNGTNIPQSDDCIDASISADGELLTFECGQNDLYLYDRRTDKLTMIDSMGNNSYSNEPIISADGSTVVFHKSAWQNNTSTEYITIYDVATGQVVHQVNAGSGLDGINLNADGMFIAYTVSGQLHVYDRAQDKVIDIVNPKNDHYENVALSSDGRYLLASYSNSPTPEEPRSHGVDLHDVTTNMLVRSIGSPAIDTLYPSMDGAADKFVFEESNALFMECTNTGGCTQTPTVAPIDSVTWSVDDNLLIGGEIKPGSPFHMHAAGAPGQQLQAVVSYTTTDGGAERSSAVTLVEDPNLPGSYNGVFPIPDHTTAITALSAELADHSFSKPATKQIPVKLAGSLEISINTLYPAALSGLKLVISSSTVHVPTQVIALPTSDNVDNRKPYAVSLPEGTDYTVQLMKGTDVVVQKDNAAVTNGGTTAIEFDPVFPASLTVTVDNVIASRSLPHVIFTDADSGQQLGDMEVGRAKDGDPYTAKLDGQIEGKRVKASIEADPYYFLPSPQEVTLLPWDNGIKMTLNYEYTIVPYSTYRFTDMSYSKAKMDSDVNFEVWSKPGASVQVNVQVQERGSDGRLSMKEESVALTEGGPAGISGTSVYTGSFSISPGIASIVSYTIGVNGVNMPSTHSIDCSVMGRMDVTVPNPLKGENADWSGMYLGVTDDTGGNVSYQPMDGSGPYKIDLPADHLYTVSEFLKGTQISQSEPVSLHNGELVKLTVSPSFPAVLSGTTVDQEGKPVAGEQLTLYAADGTALSNAVSGADGSFALKGAWTGSTVTLKAVDAGAQKATVFQKVTMAVDSTKTVTTVQMTDLPKGTLSGSVTKDGQPAAGARVIATIVHDGMIIPFTIQADHSGKYTMALPKGTITVHAEADSLTYSEASTGQVDDGGTLRLDLNMVRHVAKIHVNLYTKYIGGNWEGPMDLDWRVGVHFGLTANYPIVTLANPLEVRANPGDSVKVCVNGAQANLPSACQSAVVDSNRQGTVEFRLQQQGGVVNGTVDGPAGGFRATFYHLNAQGRIDDTRSLNESASPTFEMQLAKSGNYQVNITDAKGTQAGLWKTFVLTDGQTLDLGSLHLQALGLFEGQSGNLVTSAPDRIAPGGTAEVDVLYANDSRQATTVNDGVVTVVIPQGLSLVEHSLSVNGQTVEGMSDNGLLTVPIGTVNARDKGQIQFQVKADPQATDDSAYITASFRYSNANERKEEVLGTAEIDRTSIRLTAPPYLTSLSVPLSGEAPAGSSVTVYDGQTVVGETTASTVGFWKLEAQLPELASTSDYHHLWAESINGSNHETTEETLVHFDEDRAQLIRVSMSQPDGRVVSFDPTEGVARFPYVYIGSGFIFKLTFKQPDRVTHVRVYMNGQMADAANHNGIYEAYVNPVKPGPIWVDYDVLPDPGQPDFTVLNDQQVRDSLPAEWRNFKITKLTVPPGNGKAGTEPQTASVEADLNSGLHASLDFTFNKAAYTPTASDLARAQAYGEPVYGLDYGRQMDGDTLYYTISGYIDKSALPSNALAALNVLTDAAGKQQAGVTAKPKAVHIAGLNLETVFVNVKFGLKFFNENGGKLWSVYSLWDTLKGIAKSPPEPIFARLKPLQDIADNLCNPGLRSKYDAEIENMKGDMIVNYAFQNLIDIAGNAFDVDTLGMAAFLGISTSKMKDMVANAETEDINQLAEELKQANHCGNLHLRWWPTTADIVPIQDPSGYVYEGIPSNRLSGVTATALIWDAPSGTWKDWDASWYEQANPMESDAKGQYGWFVPDGTWKVRFTKTGYAPADSREMDVPPPRTNVNVGLTSYEVPVVMAERAIPGGNGLEAAFSKPMLIDSFRNGGLTVTAEDGSTVTGAVYGIGTEQTDAGRDAALSIRFTPDTPLKVGQTYRMAITTAAVDYAQISLASEYVQSLAIAQSDQTPPSNPGNPSAVANDSQLIVSWMDPGDLDDAKTRITWKKAGSDQQPVQMEVEKGQQWVELSDLDSGASYEITLSAVDESGNVSSGITLTAATNGGSLAPLIPQNVLDLNASPHLNDILLTWTDPAQAGMSKVAVSWQDEAGREFVRSGEAAPGAQTFTIPNLASDTSYRVTVAVMNQDGLQSRSQTVNVRTLKPDSSSGSDTENSNKETGIGTVSPGEQIQVGAGSGQAERFNGRLTLAYESGTFPSGAAISLYENKKTVALPTNYFQVSNAYTLSGPDGLQIAKPITLSLAWDSAAAASGGVDPRRLGLYRQSEQDPKQWTYAGGLAVDGQSSVEAEIDRLGTYAVLLYDHPFPDMQDHWSRQTVDVLVSRHILSGRDDSHFEPDRMMTRAELAAMLVKYAMHGELDGKPTAGVRAFTDVPPNSWYAAYVDKAYELKLINGDHGRFRPDDPVTREEMVAMLLRMFAIQPNGENGTDELQGFADTADIADWSKADLAWAAAHGILSGYEDHTLRPHAKATRAEVATVMVRMLDQMHGIEKK